MINHNNRRKPFIYDAIRNPRVHSVRRLFLMLTGYPYCYDLHCVRQVSAVRYDKFTNGEQRVNPYRIYGFNPRSVNRVLSPVIYKNQAFFDYSHVGDWDFETANINDMYLSRGLEQRFVHNCSWDESILAPANISATGWPEPSQYALFSNKQFKARAVELDALWESIRSDGNLYDGKTHFSDILAVAIGRDGELIRMCSGLHRLIMSKLLNKDMVPGRVSVIHKEYDRRNFDYDVLS